MLLECTFSLVGEKGLTIIRDTIPDSVLAAAESFDQIKFLYLKEKKIPPLAAKNWEIIPLDEEAKGVFAEPEGFEF